MNVGREIVRTIRKNLASGWLGIAAFFGCAILGTAAVLAYFYLFGQPVPVERPPMAAVKIGMFVGLAAVALGASARKR